jgi:HEAT repeat protein
MTRLACCLAVLLAVPSFAHDAGTAAPGSLKDAPKFLQVFRGADEGAMDDAIASLAALGPPVVPQLVKAMEDPLPMVRSQVAAVLTRLGPASAPAVPALTRGLSDEDANVRWNCANALGAIGKPARSALPALEKMSKEPMRAIAQAASDAMAKLRAAKK